MKGSFSSLLLKHLFFRILKYSTNSPIAPIGKRSVYMKQLQDKYRVFKKMS